MLNRVKELLFNRPQPPAHDPGGVASDGRKDDEILIAACALLVEAAALDGDFGADERATIKDILIKRLKLNEVEAGDIMLLAEKSQQNANQLLGYTRLIKDGFSHEERVEIIEMLWEVAYADGVLHDYEANLLRRVGGLIYVTDRERGEARQRVLARMAGNRADDDEFAAS
jgi:uncharacterized tellurite resistance protein B-like protein